ncbi:MAG: DUF4174 domain-containing protein [Pricia sp.]
MAITQNTSAQSLGDFQWKNRILLLVDAKPDSEALQSQLSEFTSNRNGLKERSLIIFRVTPDAVYAADESPSEMEAKDIYDRYDLALDFSGTILIGKDGGSKMKKPFEVSAKTVFDLIDSMPMRRAEMRESGRHEG